MLKLFQDISNKLYQRALWKEEFDSSLNFAHYSLPWIDGWVVGMNHEIMTWDEVRGLTNWDMQAPEMAF